MILTSNIVMMVILFYSVFTPQITHFNSSQIVLLHIFIDETSSYALTKIKPNVLIKS